MAWPLGISEAWCLLLTSHHRHHIVTGPSTLRNSTPFFCRQQKRKKQTLLAASLDLGPLVRSVDLMLRETRGRLLDPRSWVPLFPFSCSRLFNSTRSTFKSPLGGKQPTSTQLNPNQF